ncbi:MAG: hypothetical protein GWP08_08640 [Nitrospiraceae bacterium]|nr:hypothetical protein [Nitrospiraceae bacterium]
MWLPTAERRGEIQFYIAKSLSYPTRLALAFGLIAVGFIVQVALLSTPIWFVGVAGVFAGVLLLLTKGYENTAKPSRKIQEWRPARREEVERIVTINEKQKRWDQDVVDITCTRGCLTFVAVLVLLVVLAFAGPFMQFVSQRGGLPSIGSGRFFDRFMNELVEFAFSGLPRTSMLLFVNALVMVVPFWLTGVRSILKNDRLVVKAKMIMGIERAFKGLKREGEEFQYQMQTAAARDGSGDIPRDIKAIVAFHDGPEDFLGLQMQISVNNVQGKDYPYFYCVLVAKESFGELKVGRPERKIVVEPSFDNGVNIAVIRQHTTKKSGYHTAQVTANRIFRFAIAQARDILGEHSS